MQNGLVMKTLAHSCAALALSFVALAPFAIACSSAPESSSLGGDDDDVTPSKSKKTEDDDSVDSKKKSDTSAPLPTPTSTETAPAPAPTPTPTTPPVPTVDPAACANLGSCCSKITNTYGQLACVAVQIRGEAETCQKSLLGCLAAVGLGGGAGSGGAGAPCASDNDCLGGRRCNINGTCQ